MWTERGKRVMRTKKLFLVLVFCGVVTFSYENEYISNVLSLQNIPLEMIVCDLSKNLVYRCHYMGPHGFELVDSIVVVFRNVVPGFYQLESVDDNGVELKVCCPREIACDRMIIGTVNIEAGCPYAFIDSTDVEKLKGFLDTSKGRMGVIDSLCYVDGLMYKEMISHWRRFFEFYLKFREERDYEDLDDFYSDNYRDNKGGNIEYLAKAIKIEKNLDEWVEIKSEAPVVVVNGGFACISFYQRVCTGKKVEFSRKFLTLVKEAEGWKIVFEDTSVEKVEYIRDMIENFVNSWKEAWESLDIEQYKRFYSPGFRSENMGLAEWLSYKRRVFNSLQWVNISVENLSVLSQGKMFWIVEFLQRYSSNRGGDTGYKILYIEGPPEDFKIIKEMWTPISRGN